MLPQLGFILYARCIHSVKPFVTRRLSRISYPPPTDLQSATLNTQTHILLACATLIPAAPALMPQIAATWQFKVAAMAAILGALLPDASLFFMFALGKIQGVPESIIFNEWYFSETWQRIGAETNSIPVYAAVALVSTTLIRRIKTGYKRLLQVVSFAAVFAISALLHTATDLPLHNDDGHPHFWPFTDWVYVSPVSYWDPRHHGTLWSVIELCLAAGLIVFLWRRFSNRFTKVCLLIAAISYAAVASFWLQAF